MFSRIKICCPVIFHFGHQNNEDNKLCFKNLVVTMKALLNFRFDQFPEHLTQTFINLFSSKSYCDVRLIGEDRIPVMGHKVILAAFSRVLNDVIKLNSVQTLDIKIQGINHDEIETIVQFHVF